MQVYTEKDNLDNFFNKNKKNIFINAVSGVAGIPFSLKIVNFKKVQFLLANKETIVAFGKKFLQTVNKNKVNLISIDSEHNAILQATETNNAIEKILLTASGGKFNNFTRQELKNTDIKLENISHPNWDMGIDITIDSNTMINKCFEVIEAYHLFNTKNIEVLIHPQSIIHSGVMFVDGTIKFIASTPDMKSPINYGLFNKKRFYLKNHKILNFDSNLKLDLQKADINKIFPLKWAYSSFEKNNSFAVTILLANEMLRKLFKANKVKFYQIVDVIDEVLIMDKNIVIKNEAELLNLKNDIKDNIAKILAKNRYQ
ncbi:1-deoxy-D-xylulose-5-phosphate reductoisomerase [Spiroplasma endosymbiont of Anurida maritima]